MTVRARRVYWDACAWLGLLNGEANKLSALSHVWNKATRGELEIWTSAFCIAEVYKKRCGENLIALDRSLEAEIDNMFNQEFVKIVQLDSEVARLARSLLFQHQRLKKPSDAVHLATAVHWNLEQLHTYDGSDLIGLSQQTADGKNLMICLPDHIDGENLFTFAAKKEKAQSTTPEQ
jgi:predicted nucleic acid-binding protein